MHIAIRSGIVALTAASAVLGGSIAAQAAPTDATGSVGVTVDRLVFEPAAHGHRGVAHINLRNDTAAPVDGTLVVTEPNPRTLDAISGTGVCLLEFADDGRRTEHCDLDSPLAPGERRRLTVTFRSPSAPRPFARVGGTGLVGFAGASAELPSIFRSTTGSLKRPRDYVQDRQSDLAVTAGDVTLARTPDGTYAGRVPVTVRNNGDAAHDHLGALISLPPGLEFHGIEPSETCGVGGPLEPPAGGAVWSCIVAGEQLAEGQERSFEMLVTAPVGTASGVLGSGAVLVDLNTAPEGEAPPAGHVASYTAAVAG